MEARIKKLAARMDYPTVENREGRKGLQSKRDELAQEMELLAASAQQGQKALDSLLQSIETNLAIATHAEKWDWNEVEAATNSPAK